MPHILIVDDEPDLCTLLSKIVTSLDYQATTVNSGEAALEKVAQHHYDLVMLDHYMDGMSGLDTAKVLNEKAIPFVFCTSSTEDEVLRHALAQGALNYIIKPFSPAKIIFAIGSSLGRIEEQEQNNLVQLATGILMARNQSSREQAHQQLNASAQESGVTLVENARQLIAEYQA